MQYIDISVTVEPGIPVWTGTEDVKVSRKVSPEKDGGYVTVSNLEINVHTGTHIDAPRHFVAGAKTIEEVPLEKLLGECYVAEFLGKTDITAADLENAGIPDGTKKLLFKTDNSQNWLKPLHKFNTEYCALTVDAAHWIVEKGIHLVGIDYLSIQHYTGSDEVHVTLLENEVVILETINLLQVKAGKYELICLPPKIKNVEGMPVRAVLREIKT